MQLRENAADRTNRKRRFQQGARIVSAWRDATGCLLVTAIPSQALRCEGLMYYDAHWPHSQQHASSGATFVSCDIKSERECLLDATEAAAAVRLGPEPRQVMDQLLRECLKRKPLG
jgi:hypothetical protein